MHAQFGGQFLLRHRATADTRGQQAAHLFQQAVIAAEELQLLFGKARHGLADFGVGFGQGVAQNGQRRPQAIARTAKGHRAAAE